MKLSSVILRVEDMERAVGFWKDAVGLDVAFQIPGFTFLNGGGTKLILSHIDRSIEDESLTEVVFESDDVRAEFRALRQRGVPFELELRLINSDEKRDLLGAHFRDPDGHYGSLTGWVDKSDA